MRRVTANIMGYASLNMPQFNSVSVSGYHTQEDGADAALELAFTISDGLEYVRMAVEVADLKVDDVAPHIIVLLGHRDEFLYRDCQDESREEDVCEADEGTI